MPVTVETRKCWLCPDLTSTLKIPFAFLRMKTLSPACNSYSLGDSAPSGTFSMKNSSSGSYGLETIEKARSRTLSWLSTPKATYWPALKTSGSGGFIQPRPRGGENSFHAQTAPAGCRKKKKHAPNPRQPVGGPAGPRQLRRQDAAETGQVHQADQREGQV